MNARRPLALLSLCALLLAGFACLQHVEPGVRGDAGETQARAGIEGEGDIPVPFAEC